MRKKIKKYASTSLMLEATHRQDNSSKKIKYNLLLAFFIVIFIVSFVILGYQLYEYYIADKITKDLRELTRINPTAEELEDLPEDSKNPQLAALFSKYPDFKGWIKIDGTRVDNPVAQSKDNNYYLHRTLDKEWLRLGTVFADFRNTFNAEELSNNTILYGHNANNGSYFHDLIKYQKIDFYNKNKFITFETMYEDKKWVIIGAFMPSLHKQQGELFPYYNYINGTKRDFEEFIQEVNRRSYFHTNIDVKYSDKLLTLSTCDYDFEDARFVVVARQLRADETMDNMKINSWSNPNQYMPEAWYEAKGKKKSA